MFLITQSVDKKSCPFELLSSTTMMIIVYAHFNFKVQLNETLVANNNLGAVPQPLEGGLFFCIIDIPSSNYIILVYQLLLITSITNLKVSSLIHLHVYLYYIGSASRNEENGKKHVDLTEILGIAGVPTFLFIHADGKHYFLTKQQMHCQNPDQV